MRNLWAITLIFPALLLSACSGPKPAPSITLEDKPETLDTGQASSREVVYVYKEQQENLTDELKIKLNAAPLLLGSGYVRLAGVVSGVKPMALIEVGGRGLVVEQGDQLQGYRVGWIGQGSVNLLKENKK